MDLGTVFDDFMNDSLMVRPLLVRCIFDVFFALIVHDLSIAY